MRVAIVGSRSVTPEVYPQILRYIPPGASMIVSGGAAGADQLAEKYAAQQHLPLRIFRPEYAKYHRAAGLRRNIEIVQYSDYILVLWDGKSRGSAHVINTCIQEYKPVHVLIVRDGQLIHTLFGQEDSSLL